MSILIRGMDMPETCDVCPIRLACLTCGCDMDHCMIEEAKPQWTPFESRPMDEDERKYYSELTGFEMSDDAVIYCSQLPEDGQEVLVCNKYGGVWADVFCNDPDYGVGFETNGDMDGLVAWMPMPEPYKPEESEQ